MLKLKTNNSLSCSKLLSHYLHLLFRLDLTFEPEQLKNLNQTKQQSPRAYDTLCTRKRFEFVF